jgi:hypothetical protein
VGIVDGCGRDQLLEYSLDELLDREVIARIKMGKVVSEEDKKELAYQKAELENAILIEAAKNSKDINDRLLDWERRLVSIHNLIWELEADIRAGKEGSMGLEEVGKRALMVRDLNRQRIALKAEIVEATGRGFKDIKINHASE